MTAVDEFLYSVRGVFAQNRATDWTQLGVVVACAVIVMSSLTVWRARRRSQRALAVQVAAVVESARLSARDVAYLTRIADAAGLVVVDVMTRLPAFERATAGALASLSPTLRPDEGSPFERVRQLRKMLGFSPLPAHHWLGSTRELVNGDPITLAAVTTSVVAVNEASFAGDLPMAVAPARGAEVSLIIVRPEDSRYLTRVRVLAVEEIPAAEEGPGPGSSSSRRTRERRVFFAHDEQPERQQHREHVRIRMEGRVTLHVEGAADGATATLVDVSAGGLALDLHLSAQEARRMVGGAGARVSCAFDLGNGATFERVAAHVVALETKPAAAVQRMRLSFHLAEGERDRLAAAVARHQRALTDSGGDVP